MVAAVVVIVALVVDGFTVVVVDGVIVGIGFAVVVAGDALKTGTIVGEVDLMAVVEGTVGDTSESLVCMRIGIPLSDGVLGIVSD